MRSFDDDRGHHWQAALLAGSFGSAMLVFSRIGAPGVLHAALETANFNEAEQWLASADPGKLREWLARAKPWN